MAGSHEVRGSIPLGSTTDTRGARRRRRAPLFVSWAPARRAPAPGSRAYGTDRPIGRKARLVRGGVGAGRRPFLVHPDSSPHSSARAESASSSLMGIARPGRLRAYAAREEAALDLFERIEAIHDRAGRIRRLAASAPPSSKRPIGPRETAARRRRKSRRRNRGRFSGSEFANPDIDGLPEAFDVRRSLSRKGDPRDNAAIEPADRTPKKKLAYRRASADLGRLRREPNPCVRRRSGARTHSALGCMSPAESGNAGLPP